MSISVEYEGHRHPLQFKEIIDLEDQVKCNACDSNCDSYAFCCVDVSDLSCTFNLHHTCGPLPYTIKHKCHIHPLILTHSLATYEDYHRDDEFYCDACEKERDPLLPIYQCIECQFAAELECVISEVLSLLRGEHGDVELRDPLGVLGRVITKDAAKEKEEERKPALTTLKYILTSLSKDEENELHSVLKALEREKATAEEILSDADDEGLVFIKFLDDHSIDNNPIERGEVSEQDIGDSEVSEQDIEDSEVSEQDIEDSESLGSDSDQSEVVNVGDYVVEQSLAEWDLEFEVVNVGDYVVEQRLAPILKHLLSKHGDISAESMFSPRVKVFLFDMLCWCIYTMTNIKVVDITHEFLIKRSAELKTLERAGFRIQFAVDHLKRFSRAHFGLYVREQVDKINKDIEALQVKRERITSAKSTKSTFIEECLREASVLKNWKGGIGLPQM